MSSFQIMIVIRTINKTLPQKWFDEMYTSWLDRHSKRVARDGEFFEMGMVCKVSDVLT